MAEKERETPNILVIEHNIPQDIHSLYKCLSWTLYRWSDGNNFFLWRSTHLPSFARTYVL